MKKAIILTLCFILVAGQLFAASTLDEQLVDAQAEQKKHTGTLWLSVGIMALSTMPISMARQMDSRGGGYSDDANAMRILGYAGVALGLYLVYVGYVGVTKAIAKVESLTRAKIAGSSSFSSRERKAIMSGDIFLGMSEKALLLSWGDPEDVNTSVGDWGTHKQYVYGDFGPYVYVENGIVTSWQD